MVTALWNASLLKTPCREVFDHQFALVSHLLPQLRCAARSKHRRIKPGSIVHNDPNDYNLVVNDGEVGVLDFGDMLEPLGP